jgi:hypothetical protein
MYTRQVMAHGAETETEVVVWRVMPPKGEAEVELEDSKGAVEMVLEVSGAGWKGVNWML